MVSNDSDSDAFSVALYTTDSNGLPNTQSVALTAPDNFTAGVLSFAAPAGTTLAANTHYSLVITRGTGVTFLTLDGTTSDGETGLTGWSLANAHSTLVSAAPGATQPAASRCALRSRATPRAPRCSTRPRSPGHSPRTPPPARTSGSPSAATDADTGDTLSYTLGGTDDAAFDIVETSGQIRTKAGVSYDHEAKASYSVTVTASDGTASADATVTINVSDVAEPPLAPDETFSRRTPSRAPTTQISDPAGSPPENSGRPEITGYDVQYEDFDPELDDFRLDWTGPKSSTGHPSSSPTYFPGSRTPYPDPGARQERRRQKALGHRTEAPRYTNRIPLELEF